jgi:hypothetical protein
MSEQHEVPEIKDLREIEDPADVDLLLLSWTQMMAVEMIMPDEEAAAAKADLAAILSTQFGITDIRIKERTVEVYEISYRERDKEKAIVFDTEEVESIYDL